MASDLQADRSQRRVLLCGPDVSAPEIRAALLELGYEISGEAADSGAAVDAVRHLRPDAVLIDADLPPHGGVGTTQRIMRARPSVILVARAGGSAEWAQRALEVGASGYLTKPLRTEDLGPALLLASTRFMQLQLYDRLAAELRETNERLIISGLREQQYAAQLRKVTDASLQIHGAPFARAMLQVAADCAREVLGTDMAVACWIGPSSPRCACSTPEEQAAWPEDLLGLSVRLTRSCEDRRCVRLGPAVVEQLLAAHAPGATGLPVGGLLAAPLMARGGRPLGILWLTGKYGGDFTEEDEALLQQLAQITALALANAELNREFED
jgi:AmiR/NasT family two-component response regulator